MKKSIKCFLMAIILAISGFSQNQLITDFPYFQNFENSEDTVQFTISGTGTN